MNRDAAADLKLAICMQRQGRTEEAATSLEPLVGNQKAGAAQVQAAFELAQIRSEQGKLDEARDLFERVLSLEQGGQEQRFSVHALRHLAAIASKQGRADDAAALLGRIAKASDAGPAAVDALFDQASALMAAGKYQEADAAFERFLQSAPAHARAADAKAQRAIAASRLGQYETCLSLAEQAGAAPSPDVRASLAYERAWSLKELKRTDEAAKAFEQLLAQPAPASLKAHASLNLAQLRIAAEDFAGAQSVLASISPGEGASEISDHARYLRGLCELKTGHAPEAASTLESFLQANPKSDLTIPAALLAGQAQLKSNHPEAAAKHLARVVDSKPPVETLGPALLCLGEALGAAQRWDESREAFERFNKEVPNSDLWFQASFGIGWALENQGRQAEAISIYRDVVTRHKGPTAARAQFQIGECLFALKQHDEAVRELLKVDILYAYPEWSAAALYEAGRSLVQLHKPEEARKQFSQVVERFKDTEWARLATRELSATAPEPLPGSPSRSH
jgi:TolA-binding protein